MATVSGQNPAYESRETVPGVFYDRSSLSTDSMVMIAGQSGRIFERYAPEKRFCEYFDGIVYMPSPATDRHQEQAGFLFHLLDGFRCERGGGSVLMGPAVLRLTPEWKSEPDIFVRPPADAPSPQPLALLVVEILSSSTRQHDLNLKRQAYHAVGIPEIWLVDDRDRVLLADRRLGPDEPYVEERWEEGRLNSSSLPGFGIDVSWLWANPLPNARRCLEELLASPS